MSGTRRERARAEAMRIRQAASRGKYLPDLLDAVERDHPDIAEAVVWGVIHGTNTKGFLDATEEEGDGR